MEADAIDVRNYFKCAAARAETLVRGDPPVGSGLIVTVIYSGNAEVFKVMHSSVKTVSRIIPNGILSAESATDPATIGTKLANGCVSVKASATGEDNVDGDVSFLAPAAAIVKIWQSEEVGQASFGLTFRPVKLQTGLGIPRTRGSGGMVDVLAWGTGD